MMVCCRYWSAWHDQDYFVDGGWEALKAVFRGIAQVFLCDHCVSGIIVVIALALCSRVSAAMAVWGSAVSVLMCIRVCLCACVRMCMS